MRRRYTSTYTISSRCARPDYNGRNKSSHSRAKTSRSPGASRGSAISRDRRVHSSLIAKPGARDRGRAVAPASKSNFRKRDAADKPARTLRQRAGFLCAPRPSSRRTYCPRDNAPADCEAAVRKLDPKINRIARTPRSTAARRAAILGRVYTDEGNRRLYGVCPAPSMRPRPANRDQIEKN